MTSPAITALVCTRNRGSLVAHTVSGIMANDHPDFEVHVIDQSSDDKSESALSEWRSDTRFHYTRSATQGLARARNIGFRRARAGIVAMTDDDCRVPTDWLRRMAAAFATGDRIGVVFGNVVAAPHDRTKGFISAYQRKTRFVAAGIRDKPKVEGIGACMGVRRDVWVALQGFDGMLGAGSKFKSADDTDFAIRALLSGYEICETPEVYVVHHGFRTWSEGKVLIGGYLFGIGAMLAKHIRCHHWPVLHVVRALAHRWMFERPVVEFGFTPPRSLRLSGFVQGFIAGAVAPIDRHTAHFVVAEEAVAQQETAVRSKTENHTLPA
ncbi:MAG TPA: glycosyltransferase [Rhodothermia bacterium]|nr:glycosyltransferase [Rhodothermia bacterium]